MKIAIILLILALLFTIEVNINEQKIEPRDCGSVVVYTTWNEYQCNYYIISLIWWQQEKMLKNLQLN